MAESTEADILLKELEDATSESLDYDDSSGLEKFLGTEVSGNTDTQASTAEKEESVNSVSENVDESATNENNEEQSVDMNESNDQNADMNSVSENAEELSAEIIAVSEHGEADLNEDRSESPTYQVIITEMPDTGNDVEMSDTSATVSAAESMDVPEIVPNSETHVSELPIDSEDCNIISVNVAEDGARLLEIKEEIIDDTETDDGNTTFSVSPAFEANLDPKFKPTIRLQKIDVTTGKVKDEAEETGSDPDDPDPVENLVSDDDNSKDSSSTSRRPRRSIKTPVRLAKGYVLDESTKKTYKSSGSGVKSAVKTTTTPVRTIKSNFVPIRPKPAGSNVEISKKSSNVTPNIKVVSGPSVKTSPNLNTAAHPVNTKSVPSILNRKRPAEPDPPVEINNATNTPKGAASVKKQKAEPPKKPQRRHRKIFDYESYLKEHLEAEVGDKKPKSSDINGEPFQLLSSLVGVDVPPSKIKVLPFAQNSTSTLKSKKTNENESNNIQSKRTDRTLYDLMQDISFLLPSWNLHIMPDSNTFCIGQVCRSRSGIPILKTSIELDAQFNGKVFIHQLHCKRYDGVYDSEESISALIQEIDSLSK